MRRVSPLEPQRAGCVWLIGAGPGDPWLITVRGRELLGRADVVLYDALSHPALLDWCRPGAELRSVGKRYGARSPDQAWITAQLIELARSGLRVARLKGGDPLLFARGAEEAQALSAAKVRFEIVPGIASPVAATAYAGISLTHRDVSSSVTFITGSDREGKEWSPGAWQKLATATDTICVLMGMRRIQEICAAILAGGRSAKTPVAVVQWGAQAAQRVITGSLADIAARVEEAGLTNPAVIVVGEVVRLRDQLSWYESLPLFGKRLLVPRPAAQARETAALIRERAAEPWVLPTIRVEPPPEPARLEAALCSLGRYDWVVFTSANGVTRSFAELSALGLDSRAFGGVKLACIGPRTAQALTQFGLRADLMAREYVGEALAEALLDHGVGQGSRVLVLRALAAREVLPERLRAVGAEVAVVPAYQTLPLTSEARTRLLEAFGALPQPPPDPTSRSVLEAARHRTGRIDVALFTSSSTVHSLVDALGERAPELCRGTLLASIGEVTSRTLRERGLWVDVEATEYTVPGLLDALERHYHTTGGA